MTDQNLGDVAQAGLSDVEGHDQPTLDGKAPEPRLVVSFLGVKYSTEDPAEYQLGQKVRFTVDGTVIEAGGKKIMADGHHREIVKVRVDDMRAQ